MLNLEKAFADQVHNRIARVDYQKRVLKSQDPFGGLGLYGFEKVEHDFQDGHRVRINAPNHEAHGMTGEIEDANNSSRIRVKLDSGHTVHCRSDELMAEGSPGGGLSDAEAKEAARKIAADLQAGRIAVLDEGFRPFILRDSVLRSFAAKGLIIFRESLGKRRRPTTTFRRGDHVKSTFTGETGKVVEISESGLITIQFSAEKTGLCLPENVTAV
jgi:hypothetical protein